MIDRLEKLLWSVLAIAQFVWILLRGKIQAAEAKAAVESLKRKYAENKADIEKENSGKSSDDIIDEHLRKG